MTLNDLTKSYSVIVKIRLADRPVRGCLLLVSGDYCSIIRLRFQNLPDMTHDHKPQTDRLDVIGVPNA